MHPSDCPAWDYEDHPEKDQKLPPRVRSLLTRLRSGDLEFESVCGDTRPSHEHFFAGLTPSGYEYFAGHYRGEDFRCLKYYRVMVKGDPHVGHPPESVEAAMLSLHERILEGIEKLDESDRLSQLKEDEQLLYIVRFASAVFVDFLTVHPYANGNGHMARLIVSTILGQFGHWPSRWTVDPRPAGKPYGEYIFLHRRGETGPLEKYILSMLQ